MTIKYLVIAFIVLLGFFQVPVSASDPGPVEGMHVFLANPRVGAAKDGLVVIRNFTSGGFGARGKNVRNEYLKDRVPPSGVVPVRGEIPISPKEMFASLPREISKFSVYKLPTKPDALLDLKGSGTAVPETEELIQRLYKLFGSARTCSPCVLSLNHTAVVADAQIITGILVGDIAILHQEQNVWKVRAILDLR